MSASSNTSDREGRRSGGNFRERKLDVSSITFRDFANPWNFFHLFSQDDSVVHEWCRQNGLLATSFPCPVDDCSGNMDLRSLSRGHGGVVFRCSSNRNHTRVSRVYSFFEKSNVLLQDILLFIKSYLEKNSLAQCSRFSGFSYTTTAVNWASYIREVFKEHFYTNLRHRKLRGIVEIDESLFGRRVKFHRGNPNRGMKVWIFGMVERETNTLIIYPVSNRSEETLVPIIERHVETGSTIYSDGWSAYCGLNELGYNHFTVLHKYSFKKVYIHQETREEVEIHTNRIEGAWKHAKDHFRRMSGTKISQFEGHLCEIMWRAETKSNLYQSFFQSLSTIYTLRGPPVYTYPTPIFPTWSGLDSAVPLGEWEIKPGNTDAETDSEAEGERSLSLFSATEADSISIPSNRQLSSGEVAVRKGQVKSSVERAIDMMEMFVSSEDEVDADKTICANPSMETGDVQYLGETGPSEVPIQRGKGIENIDASCSWITTRRKRTAPPMASKSIRTTTTTCTTSTATSSGSGLSKKLKAATASKCKTDEPSGSKAESTGKCTKDSSKRMRTDKVCHPQGFAEKNPQTKKVKKPSNPYSKTAFVWSSSDDDFQ